MSSSTQRSTGIASCFFSGRPWWLSSAYGAITIPNPLGLCGYRIYLGDNTDFCNDGTINTIVHEGFHVQQFTGIAGGCGFGVGRPGLLKYLVCYFSAGFNYDDNPFEIEAYAQENAFAKCHTIKVCDCKTGEPVFNPAALDALKACNENLIVTRPRIPKCGKWWAWLLGLILLPLLAVVAFLGHLFDFLDCKYLEMQSKQCAQWGQSARQQCNAWADQGYSACTQWADQGYSACTQWADQGYSACQQYADWGYNACCDWAPCSWFCDALVWISNIVCVVSVWVANVVCVVSVWIANVVCVVSVWIANVVCILWVTIIEIVCVVWIFVIRTILFCWWR